MVVDSSIWLEILVHGLRHQKCERALQAGRIRVPTLVLFEVFKKLKIQTSEDVALEAVASLSQNEVLDLSREISIMAADLSIEHDLGMADAIVLAHARHLDDDLVTLDSDFAGIPGVVLIK